MAQWCGGCAQLRGLVRPAWPTCKGLRLCAEVDRSLINLLAERAANGKCDLAEARRVHHVVGNGLFAASRAADSCSFPHTAAEFSKQLLELHRVLFQGSGFDFAGRFRIGQEHVEFGGDHQHRQMGAHPSEIPSRIERLGALFFRGDPRPLTREEFIQHAAWFLGEFFRIHPFRDGNGRVARFMLKVASNASGSVRMGVWGGDSRSRRKYVKALQCAHKAARRLRDAHPFGDSRVGFVGPSFADPSGLGPLVAFLGNIILDRQGDDVFEEEPLPPTDIKGARI